MKITRVVFHGKYSVNSTYLDTAVDIEGELEEKDTVDSALNSLKYIADQRVKQWKQDVELSSAPIRQAPITEQPQVIDLSHEKMEIAIDNCQTIEHLKEWKSNNPTVPGKILSHYNNRLKDLSNG